MKDLVRIEKTITMSSREIATLCGKEHRNVLADVRNLCQQLEIDVLSFQHIYLDSMNREQTEYLLDKETCLCLVAGYNAKLRMAIIKRWQELENTQRKLPQDYPSALRALADEVEQHQITKQQLAIAEPKADYFDALVERNLLTNFRDTAKELHVKPKDFVMWLIEKKFIYRDSKNHLKPYAEHSPDLFELKEFSNGKKAGVQTLITPKGRETFRLLLG